MLSWKMRKLDNMNFSITRSGILLKKKKNNDDNTIYIISNTEVQVKTPYTNILCLKSKKSNTKGVINNYLQAI